MRSLPLAAQEAGDRKQHPAGWRGRRGAAGPEYATGPECANRTKSAGGPRLSAGPENASGVSEPPISAAPLTWGSSGADSALTPAPLLAPAPAPALALTDDWSPDGGVDALLIAGWRGPMKAFLQVQAHAAKDSNPRTEVVSKT